MNGKNEVPAQEEAYYVGIEGSVELRRTVLETAKNVVTTVSAHKKIQAIQDEKLRLRTQLVHVIHDLRKDLHELHVKLPKREVPEVRTPTPMTASTAKRRAGDSKLDKIEAALAEIEARMRQL
jgi:hypothetical protein